MFNELSERLQGTIKNLRGRGRLTEENIQSAMREVRIALLGADVSLPVVNEFIDRVRERAVGTEVLQSVAPGQVAVRIVHDALAELMGGSNDALNLRARPPVVVMMAGLQGSGKTTTAAKLGRYLQERENKAIMLASADIYRPAALEQLERLAAGIGVSYFSADSRTDPVTIAKAALDEARRNAKDVLIFDTAGRLHVDDAMMEEIGAVHAVLHPVETLFVVDSTMGQDAVNSARIFDSVLPLTGIVLTKIDGDTRGGVALSVRHVTGKPIKFLGTGEATDALEPFHPDRMASRILGMGDVVTLVEEAERKVDKARAEKLARKLTRGKGFDLDDFRQQILEMERMGGIATLMDRLPGMSGLPDAVKRQVDSRPMHRMVAIINSMTPHERRFPAVIRGSRKRRIAAGSGTAVQDVNRLLKQFAQMEKVFRKMGKRKNLDRMLRQAGGPGFRGFPM